MPCIDALQKIHTAYPQKRICRLEKERKYKTSQGSRGMLLSHVQSLGKFILGTITSRIPMQYGFWKVVQDVSFPNFTMVPTLLGTDKYVYSSPCHFCLYSFTNLPYDCASLALGKCSQWTSGIQSLGSHWTIPKLQSMFHSLPAFPPSNRVTTIAHWSS